MTFRAHFPSLAMIEETRSARPGRVPARGSIVRRAAAAAVVGGLALTLGGFVGGAADHSADEGIRPIDGVGNNVAHPYWGTPDEELLREASGFHYADGISAP